MMPPNSAEMARLCLILWSIAFLDSVSLTLTCAMACFMSRRLGAFSPHSSACLRMARMTASVAWGEPSSTLSQLISIMRSYLAFCCICFSASE